MSRKLFLLLSALGFFVFSVPSFAVDNYANAEFDEIHSYQCINSNRVKSQFDSYTPNLVYMKVRHHGDPGTAELLNQVATSVGYDVSVYSGYQPPFSPLVGLSYAQRGYYDLGPPDGSSAVQVYCANAGFMINTYQFSHAVPVTGGGPNVAYDVEFRPTKPVFNHPGSSELTLQAYIKLPWFLDVGGGIGQVVFYVTWIDTSENLKFFQLMQVFDTRPWGSGNGSEFVAYDPASLIGYASSPLKNYDKYGSAVQFITKSPYSQTMQNDTTWSSSKFFRVHVSEENLAGLVEELRAGQPALYENLSSNPGDYELASAGVIAEVLLPSTTDNISMGGSLSYFEVYEAYEE